MISLSGNLYKINVDPDSKNLKIIWEQKIDKNGKPVSGVLINQKGNLLNGFIPFDKDKIVMTELNITEEKLFEIIQNDETLTKYLNQKEFKKRIYIKNKLMNIII